MAWEKLYRQYQATTRRFLLRMGVEAAAVDDICQEVFLQAFRHLPRFRGECSFQTWLYRICVSEARRSRQRARISQVLCTLVRRQARESVTCGELSPERAHHLVQGALGTLPDQERLVFVLYELEGMSGREVALVAQCPEATVWRRLHYARKAFRTYVAERGAGS